MLTDAIETEQIGSSTLYLGDSMVLLEGEESSIVDAVVTDPPYGMGYFHGGGGGGGIDSPESARARGFSGKDAMIQGDDKPFNPSLCLQYGETHVIWGGNHFSHLLPRNPKWLVWDKIVVKETYGKFTFSDCEMAWTSIKKTSSARIYHHLWQGCRRAGESNKGGKLHPNRKPVQLMEWCIKQAGSPSNILDPYMGSGTTGVACENLGLAFIGIEIDKKYFDIACERIFKAVKQGKLL